MTSYSMCNMKATECHRLTLQLPSALLCFFSVFQLFVLVFHHKVKKKLSTVNF